MRLVKLHGLNVYNPPVILLEKKKNVLSRTVRQCFTNHIVRIYTTCDIIREEFKPWFSFLMILQVCFIDSICLTVLLGTFFFFSNGITGGLIKFKPCG